LYLFFWFLLNDLCCCSEFECFNLFIALACCALAILSLTLLDCVFLLVAWSVTGLFTIQYRINVSFILFLVCVPSKHTLPAVARWPVLCGQLSHLMQNSVSGFHRRPLPSVIVLPALQSALDALLSNHIDCHFQQNFAAGVLCFQITSFHFPVQCTALYMIGVVAECQVHWFIFFMFIIIFFTTATMMVKIKLFRMNYSPSHAVTFT
jgi:hypothetical protein